MHKNTNRILKIIAWLGLGVLFWLAVKDFPIDAILKGNQPSISSRRYVLFLAFEVILSVAWAAVFIAIWKEKVLAILVAPQSRINRFARPIRFLLAGLVICLPTILFLFSPFGYYNVGFWFRLLLMAGSTALAAFFLFSLQPQANWWLSFSGILMVSGGIYVAGSYLNSITDYPFSLSWSEGNRLWDYSTMFAANRYILPAGEKMFAFISPGRQFLWAVVFLIPNVSISIVRLWDSLVWIWPAFVLGCSVFVRKSDRWLTVLAGMWTLLFLNQGPIYSPLLVSAILVILAVRQKSLWAAIVLVGVASFYAQVSRWTWVFAPGLWAGLLALLELPNPALRLDAWKSLVRPVGLGLAGLVGGLVPAILQNVVTTGGTANPAVPSDLADAITRQPLLWDRLLPNATYPPGILLAALWAGLPAVILLAWLVYKKLWKINTLQTLAVVVISLVFLGAGLVASVKIGGGGNLHNLDMFWVTLALVVLWACKDLATLFNPAIQNLKPILVGILLLAVLGPVTYNIQSGSPLAVPSLPNSTADLQTLRSAVATAQKEKEVLFIDQRQLLTFGEITGVPLIADYEKKYMMDQAMAGDAVYFKQFYTDLANQRFSLIVSEPLNAENIKIKGSSFGEENNAWVTWVSQPILCYYESQKILSNVNVQLLVPRANANQDPTMNCPKP